MDSSTGTRAHAYVHAVIERIYAPEESNIIPQCSAGPGHAVFIRGRWR
jgi:hypothetical protein